MLPTNVRAIVDRFKRLKTLVIGDLMLDHFIWGSVSRISPEAPVPVVQVSRETEMPGGAGNVAVNIAALGSEVYIVGLLGEDTAADRLISLLQRSPIRTDSAIRTPERPTTVKTRIIAQHQQVVRVDREVRGDYADHLRDDLWARVESLLPTVQAVVLSDYAKGVITPFLVQRLIPAARKLGIPITVDPKVENFHLYRQVTCVTPNTQEAMDSAGVHSMREEKDVDRIGQMLLKRINADSLLMTRGEHGMALFEKGEPVYRIPTRAREVFDVTGAGDTVIGTLTLALAAGAPVRMAAELANYAAGLVVGKLGTASVTALELLAAVGKNMIERRQDVLAVIPSRYAAQRFPGKPLALIAGKPLVQWVWEAAKAARRVTRVVVATDSEKIARVVRDFGGEAVMTSPRCPSGTDRVAQVARASRAGIVVNVQGDEPLLSPLTIDKVVAVLQEDASAVMSTAVRKPENDREWRDPNAVKAVLDRMNFALYFSRAPLPNFARGAGAPAAPRWIHIGLYAFRRAFLFRFAALPPSTLEQAERLEQLRVLEHGCAIKVAVVSQKTCAVDRPGDVRKVELLMTRLRAREKSL